jgi:hypothetical protein
MVNSECFGYRKKSRVAVLGNVFERCDGVTGLVAGGLGGDQIRKSGAGGRAGSGFPQIQSMRTTGG